MNKGKLVYSMKKRRNRNTIVVINSYKGGSGKTSIALSYCVTRAYNNKKRAIQENKAVNEKVFFIDIDLLGTGSGYMLLGEGEKKTRWLNSEDRSPAGSPLRLDEYVNELKMKQEKDPVGEFEIYGILSNPVTDAYFQEENSYRKNRSVEEAVYRKRIKDILEEIMRDGSDNYIVMDCSPGVSSMEREIMNIIYGESRENEEAVMEVKEVYITTYDNGHVKKTVQNLKKIQPLSVPAERNIVVVLNDIHNIPDLKKLSDSQEGIEGAFHLQLEEKDAVEEVQRELKHINNLKVCTVAYNKYMAASSLYQNEESVVGRPDKYIFNDKIFHEYGEPEYEKDNK